VNLELNLSEPTLLTPGLLIDQSDQQIVNLLKIGDVKNIVVQEKVDGANVSVHFTSEWEPVIQKRSGIIGTGEKSQYNVYRDWVFTNMDTLWTILGTDYVLFGEWLWYQHSIAYNMLPDFFICFDIFEKKTEKYVCYKTFTEMIGDKFQTVPLVRNWTCQEALKIPFGPSVQSLMNTKSKFGNEVQEGLYIRFESDTHVLYRTKIRRKTFTCGRDDFESNPKTNQLKK